MRTAQLLQQLLAKASEAILMGQHHALNFPCQDSIYQLQKLLALNVETAADFHDPLVYLASTLLTVLLKRCFLVLQLRFLRLTGNPTISDRTPILLQTWQPQCRG